MAKEKITKKGVLLETLKKMNQTTGNRPATVLNNPVKQAETMDKIGQKYREGINKVVAGPVTAVKIAKGIGEKYGEGINKVTGGLTAVMNPLVSAGQNKKKKEVQKQLDQQLNQQKLRRLSAKTI